MEKINENGLNEKQINEIVNFVNNNFEVTNIQSKKVNNYKNLVKFLEENSYEINVFDAEIIISKSEILENTLNSIIGVITPVNSTNGLFDYLELNYELYDCEGYFNKKFTKNQNIDSFGNYLKHIGQFSVLSPLEEKELFLRYKNGDESAYEDIINHNLRLVVNIAKRYSRSGLDFDDLVQEGNEGLMIAIERFDPNRGYKFSTCAYWWIKQKIQRGIYDKGRTIRVPVHTQEEYLKIKKISDEYENKYGHEPTNQEISQISGFPIAKIYDLKKAMLGLASLNSFVGEDGEEELAVFIEDDETNVEASALSRVLSEEFREFYEKTTLLKEREKEVLMLRYGSTQKFTLEDVGKLYGITRERARQIELKALRKLRDAEFVKSLSDKKTKPQVLSYNYYKKGEIWPRR